MNIHIILLQDSHLAGLTPRGWFHIDWLHLNRPQLVAMRQRQTIYQRTQKIIEEMQEVNQQLLERIASQEQELYNLRQQMHRLMRYDL